MPSFRKKAKAAVPFNTADLADIKNNPYVQRLIEDSDLRDSVKTALDSGKSAYERLTSSKAPHRAVLEDKKLQSDVRQAAEAVRDATLGLTNAPKRKAKKRRLGRTLLIALVGATAALAGSEKLRGKVLDTLFGAEEEFQYTPPASAPAPAPAAPVTAA